MILIPELHGRMAESKIVAHIKSEFAELCDRDFYVDNANIEEVAKAVETFIEQDESYSCVSSGQLVMLVSRALASVGETPAARRFLVFGSGMVKPSEWEVTAGESMWVLDLKQITLSDDAKLELIFFTALNILLEAISDIWDESSGRGVLGLRHICSAASLLLCDDSGKEQRLLVEEIKDACVGKLEQIQVKRLWEDCPRVMNLDL